MNWLEVRSTIIVQEGWHDTVDSAMHSDLLTILWRSMVKIQLTVNLEKSYGGSSWSWRRLPREGLSFHQLPWDCIQQRFDGAFTCTTLQWMLLNVIIIWSFIITYTLKMNSQGLWTFVAAVVGFCTSINLQLLDQVPCTKIRGLVTWKGSVDMWGWEYRIP